MFDIENEARRKSLEDLMAAMDGEDMKKMSGIPGLEIHIDLGSHNEGEEENGEMENGENGEMENEMQSMPDDQSFEEMLMRKKMKNRGGNVY